MSINGELTANTLLTTTLPVFFLTVNLSDTDPPFLDVTNPSKDWILSFLPSLIHKSTLTMSPTLNSGTLGLICFLLILSIKFIKHVLSYNILLIIINYI